MRAVLQRVTSASVTVDSEKCARIGNGLVILLGIEHADGEEDMDWLVRKILNMRIFGDRDGKMNLSILDVGGDIIVVSQFTLHASTRKGNRPGFVKAADPKKAETDYQHFVKKMRQSFTGSLQTGVFGAMMDVELINSGPVTIIIDSKIKE